MLVEMARVLGYPRVQQLFHLSQEQIYEYVQFLRNACEIVPVHHALNVPIRDPKDVMVLETAILGEADLICTLDSDFYSPETFGFCAAADIEVAQIGT
jgi:putative PIN family toxin of toxin-antitoxin system